MSFFAAKDVPGARKWAGIVFGLIVLQVALAFVAFGAPIVGALHGINALAILGTAAARDARPRTTPGRPAAQRGSRSTSRRRATGSAAPQSTRPV